MPEKTVTLAELRKMTEEGAEVEIERRPAQIVQFDELVDALKEIVANEAERVRADIARNQTNLEILATLQGMVRKQAQAPQAKPTDFGPLVQILEELRNDREAARMPVPWDFDIKRDGRGFAQSITATPIGGSKTH